MLKKKRGGGEAGKGENGAGVARSTERRKLLCYFCKQGGALSKLARIGRHVWRGGPNLRPLYKVHKGTKSGRRVQRAAGGVLGEDARGA